VIQNLIGEGCWSWNLRICSISQAICF